MSKALKTKCGRVVSSNGKLFTQQSLAQHEKDCRLCNLNFKDEFEEYNLKMANLIAGDEPDGVFWGIAWEMGESW